MSEKRRYSSTAVGFPIRNDQKPHQQRNKHSSSSPTHAHTREKPYKAANTSLPRQRPAANTSLPRQRPTANTSLPRQRPAANTSLPRQRHATNTSLPRQRPAANTSLPRQRPAANTSLTLHERLTRD